MHPSLGGILRDGAAPLSRGWDTLSHRPSALARTCPHGSWLILTGPGSVPMGLGTASSAMGRDFNQLCPKPCGSAGPPSPSHAPLLPQNPPNFLRASALSEHISPVVVIPAEASSPDSEPITDLVEMDTASQVSHCRCCTARAPSPVERTVGVLQL